MLQTVVLVDLFKSSGLIAWNHIYDLYVFWKRKLLFDTSELLLFAVKCFWKMCCLSPFVTTWWI